ncbi:MAG: branched-chain amino acid transport [Glaciihabitans sp.]|nr:branched-chain amino acid transport [Glaciihabitans sp.]
MNVWTIVLIASVAVLALKLVGYAVPTSLVEKPGPARISSLLTVALLSALIAVQTFVSSGHTLALDARLPALLVAAGLFALRVPFILVLVAAAATAAVIRMLT